MVTKEQFESALESRLDASMVDVVDTSGGCGQAFEITVVSDQFSGKNRLARARAVNAALHDEIAEVHAFSQKTYTNDEWNALKNRKA